MDHSAIFVRSQQRRGKYTQSPGNSIVAGLCHVITATFQRRQHLFAPLHLNFLSREWGGGGEHFSQLSLMIQMVIWPLCQGALSPFFFSNNFFFLSFFFFFDLMPGCWPTGRQTIFTRKFSSSLSAVDAVNVERNTHTQAPRLFCYSRMI